MTQSNARRVFVITDDGEHPDGWIPAVVTEGQPGHALMSGDGDFSAPWHWGTRERAETLAAQANIRMEFSEKDVFDVIASAQGAAVFAAAEAIRDSLDGTPAPVGTDVIIRVQELVRAVKEANQVSEETAEQANALWVELNRATARDAISNHLILVANLLDAVAMNQPPDGPVFAAAAAVAAAYLP